MSRSFVFAFALTFSVSAAFAQADGAIGTLQNTYVAAPGTSNAIYTQQEPASIERTPAAVRNRPSYASAPRVTSSQVIAGVWVRSESGAHVETVASNRQLAELRIESGRANVMVNHPAQDTQILVDLPGGQTALVKDGVYTFNAANDTVHVLEGEAEAFPENREEDGIKLKDNRMYAFGSGDAHAKLFEPTASDTDLLAGGFVGMGGESGHRGYGYGGGEYVYVGSPYYGGGFAPYYGLGGPYGWGYPYGYGYRGWGYGYPFGIGIGFGYGGGYFGGYRGGFRGGFGGGGFGRGGFRR